MNHYNQTLSTLLDVHAPVKQRTVVVRTNTPWYNDNVREEKQKRRRLERKWVRTHLEIDHQCYRKQWKVVTSLVHTAKKTFYLDKITECGGDQRQLFRIIKNLLGHSEKSMQQLANHFSDFFCDKIGGDDEVPPPTPIIHSTYYA